MERDKQLDYIMEALKDVRGFDSLVLSDAGDISFIIDGADFETLERLSHTFGTKDIRFAHWKFAVEVTIQGIDWNKMGV